jgi:hypothetical protein
MWESPEPDAAETGWAQRFFSAMEPYSTGGLERETSLELSVACGSSEFRTRTVD